MSITYKKHQKKEISIMDKKQRAKELGYVNFGYISPDTSSNDEYPGYIKDGVEEAIRKIKMHQNSQSISFAFMTDIHYS